VKSTDHGGRDGGYAVPQQRGNRLVMAPIAASFAGQLGFNPDAFLMAVAIGAGCDFLTP
jgi:hypothetical protein